MNKKDILIANKLTLKYAKDLVDLGFFNQENIKNMSCLLEYKTPQEQATVARKLRYMARNIDEKARYELKPITKHDRT